MEPVPVAPLAPPAAWQGGKRHLAERLVARIEAIPHDLYAEPFLGMGGVFFRRQRRPRLEVVNDLNRDVATFFRVLQRHPLPLLNELLNFTVASRAEFDRLRAIDPATLTDLERAARFYYLQRLAYSGKPRGQTFGVSATGRYNILAQRRLLEKIHARLAGTVIECLPYDEMIERYDRPAALFYLDPPYWSCTDDYGPGMFARGDFAKLAKILAGLKGRFLLSLNDTPGGRETFKAFEIEMVETTYTIGNAERGAAVAEVIISDGRRAGDGMTQQLGLL